MGFEKRQMFEKNKNVFEWRFVKMYSTKILMSTSVNKTKKTWHIETGQLLKTFSGHSDWVNFVLKLSNELIASCLDDKIIKVWNINTGICLRTI